MDRLDTPATPTNGDAVDPGAGGTPLCARPTPLRRTLVRLRRHPSAIMLVVQLLGILLYPFIEHTDAGRIGFNVFGIAVLAATTRMVRRTPFRTWIGVAIAAPALVLLCLQAMGPRPDLQPWSSGLEAIFYFYAAGSLIAYMLEDRRATADELFCAGGTFTLLAWGFTYLFLLVQALQPNSFGAAVHPELPRTWTELMYLSFALLSSTGIGDVVPLTTQTRAIASVAMFVGVMYLAAVVSRLIGLTLQQQER